MKKRENEIKEGRLDKRILFSGKKILREGEK
jgi:hypothetical protein